MDKKKRALIHKSVVKILEDAGIQVVPMNHAWRLNDCVDLFKKLKTVHDIVDHKYYQFELPKDAVEFAIEMALENSEKRCYKRTELGNMAYKEFCAIRRQLGW